MGASRTLRLARRVVVPVACVGMVLGMAPSVAAAPADLPHDSLRSRLSAPIKGVLEDAPGLSVSAQAMTGGRPGGRATFQVVVASAKAGGAPLRDLEVRIAVPDKTSLRDITGEGWRCAVGADRMSALCSHAGAVDQTEDPTPMVATLDIDASFSGRTARIDSWARWAGEPRTLGNWVVAGEGGVPVYPKVTLRLTPNASDITAFGNGPRQSRQFQLQAEIGRLQGQYATLAWRQLAGPPVRFLLPEKADAIASTVDQIIEVTKVADRQRYVFAAKVEAQGQVVEERVSVTVRGERLLGEVAAPSPTEAAIARSTVLPDLQGALTIGNRRDLRIAGPLVVTAGTNATLRVRGADARRGQVRWSVDGHPLGSGTTMQVSAAREAGDTRLIEASVALPNGVVAQAAHILMSSSSTMKSRSSTQPSGRSRSEFCRVADAVRAGRDQGGSRTYVTDLGTKSGQSLTFAYADAAVDEDVFADGSCSGSGTITIRGGVLVQSSDVRLGRVRALLTAEKLTVTSARVAVNSTFSGTLTDALGLDATGVVTAPLTSAGFGIATGEMVFEPISIDGRPAGSPVEALLGNLPGWEAVEGASRIVFTSDTTVKIAEAVRSPVNPQGTRAQVSVDLELRGDDPMRASATVANFVLGQTPRGGVIAVSGHGEFDAMDETFTLRLPVECAGGWASEACEIFNGFRFQRVGIEWTDKKIALDATAAITAGQSTPYPLAFKGTYRGPNDWDLSVSNPAPWDLGKGMVIRDLRGGLASLPSDDTASLRFAITGTFAGLDLGKDVRVQRLTPTLTNECPDTEEASACPADEVRLLLTAELSAVLPGNSAPTTFGARAEVNLKTLDFVFESGATDLNIGPEEMQITDVRLVVSRGASTSCVPKGEVSRDDTGITVRFAGSARILTKTYDLNIQSDERGLCIWGSGDSIDIGGGFKAVAPKVAFTTFAKGAEVDGVTDIKPNLVVLNGGFVFPESFKEKFGIPGRGVTFEAKVATDLVSAHFTVAYNANNEVTLYRGEGAHLTLGQAGFGADVRFGGASPGFDGYLFGSGRLDIEGSAKAAGSSTPLDVRIGVGYTAGTSLRIQLQAGVPSGQVRNAFGVEGLTVRRLSASAAIDLLTGAPSVALNADVTLPAGWTQAIGLTSELPVALAVNLDALTPCLEFRVGTKDGEAVVDFAGEGFITGHYFRLVLAPSGCLLPDGRGTTTIAPGWAFAVQGALLGSPFEAAAGLEIDDDGVRVDAVVELPRLDLYGVVGLRTHDTMGGPRVTLNVDTGAGVFDVHLNGGIEIGDVRSGLGLLATVKGDIKKAGDRFTVDLTGRSQTRVGPVDIALDPIKVTASIPMAGKESAKNQLFVDMSASVRATLNLDVLGTYTVTGSGRLQMHDFVVTQLSLKANATIDVVIYKVTGVVAFDLCTGTLSDIKADGTGSQCTLFSKDKLATSTPAVRIGVSGTEFKPLENPKPFTYIAYEHAGVEK